MEYINTEVENMDVQYVYEPVQDPMPYRSGTPYNRSHYKTHPLPYISNLHYAEKPHFEDTNQYVSIHYDGASGFRGGNQAGSRAQGGSWQVAKRTDDQEYVQGVRGYTKSFAKGNVSGYPEKEQTVRSKGRGTSFMGSNYGVKSKAVYNTPGGTFAGNSYEEQNKVGYKPLNVKVINQRSVFGKEGHTTKGGYETARSSISSFKPSQPQQRVVHRVPSPMTNLGVKKLGNVQSSYSSPFMESSKYFYQQESLTTTENGDKIANKFRGPGGIRKKRKKSAAEKHIKLKKYVQPKNAIMCLNELVQGTVLKFEQEGVVTIGNPICMTVEVNGQKYKGYGSSRPVAKQAAAEAALVSFVKPPPAPTDDAAEDKTPWAVLASFAMFKLFNEWKEGRIGMCQPVTNSVSFGTPSIPDPTLSQTFQAMLGKSMQLTMETAEPMKMESKDSANVFNSYLADNSDDVKKIPNPAKQVPENAVTIHPVMLLHQMRPTLTYTQSAKMMTDHQIFTLKCMIDGQMFEGEGLNVKKAKLNLAIKANEQLFGVRTTYQPTA